MFDINPSRQPIMRTMVRAISPMELLLALLAWVGVLAVLAAGAEPPVIVDQRQPAAQSPLEQAPLEQAPLEQAPLEQASQEQAPEEQAPIDQGEAERQAVWYSPPMLAARAWLEEYFRTSKRQTPEQERAYLDRLSRLSAEEMRTWLKQMGQHRMRILNEQQTSAVGRQWSMQQASEQQLKGRLAAQQRSFSVPQSTMTQAQPNYVRAPATRRAAELSLYGYGLGYDYGDGPLRSFQILNYLDTMDIRDELRERRLQNPR